MKEKRDNVPTNHDLHIMLIEMKGDISGKLDSILDGQVRGETWQKNHEKSDKEDFKAIRDDIKLQNKYGKSIAIVAGFIGFCLATGATAIKKFVGIS